MLERFSSKMAKSFILGVLMFGAFFKTVGAVAEPKVGDQAPGIKLQTHEGKSFDLQSRKGQWTVLYFYPKADTPGCTKQACAFRDSISEIRKLNADVFGISIDSVKDQAKFHEKNNLNFTLLADADGTVAKAYGTKMPLVPMAKRWTFLIDPDLRIRFIDDGVSPAKDAGNMAAKLKELQANE